MKWLENGNDYVRVLSFDFSKAFDSVSHHLVIEKIKLIPGTNPLVVNWVIDFLEGRRQKVCVDGLKSPFLSINRGVPQGTVSGSVLFTIIVNDIRPVPYDTIMMKYADDITCSLPVGPSCPSAVEEVNNIKGWASQNLMSLYLKKTKELLINGKTNKEPPIPVSGIEQVSSLRLFGDTFNRSPVNWDTHFEE